MEAERARWFCWVPVAFGGGIGAYFSLPQEPSRLLLAALVFLSIAIWLVARRGTLAPFIAAGLIWGSAGAFAAALRADLVQAPVLSKPLEGRAAVGFLEAIEPRLPKGWRLTLRLKALEGVASDARPRRIRIVWAGDHAVRIGDAVRVRVFLRPPPIPVRPGGYDFARRAYFDQIGAVGFAVSRPERVRDLPRRPTLLAGVASIGAVRRLIAERVERAVPGETGALINALIVGERGRVSEPTLEHLRRSGLSHLLAISGMHMAMIAGALFAMLRVFFAAVPALALRFPIKKLAALAALAGGIGYLAVSGASVATQRAAIMIGLMLVAVLLDRPAISLRNVALAALVIMALGPENLLEIGFQMSFAAVVALVAFYEWWRDRPAAQAARAEGRSLEASRLLPAPIAFIWRGGRGLIVGTLVTTFIAGLAVAPLGAFHFHKIAQFSLAANLFAMPVFTLVVMPMALVSLLAMPLGLEGLPLSTMGWGVEQVRAVAADVSERPGAVRALVAMPPAAFFAVVAGGLWLALWRTGWRVLGLLGIGGGLVFATTGLPPDVIVGRDGKLVAVRGSDGALAISPGRAGAFEIGRWLEADGDPRADGQLSRGAGFRCDEHGCLTTSAGAVIAMPANLVSYREDCRRAAVVIVAFSPGIACPSAEVVVRAEDVQRRGVHQLRRRPDGRWSVETVARVRGARLWSRPSAVSPATP